MNEEQLEALEKRLKAETAVGVQEDIASLLENGISPTQDIVYQLALHRGHQAFERIQAEIEQGTCPELQTRVTQAEG